MFTVSYFLNLLYSLPGIFIAISFHEMAHAYAADAMGDPTPKLAGRLTANPLKHMDYLGFLCMLVMHFGWAKPVPINPNNFENRRKGIILVSLSGVFTNLLLAFITMPVYFFIIMQGGNEVLETIIQYIFNYNVVFAVFNILPIPPLDGSNVLAEFLPYNAKQTYLRFGRYSIYVLMILMFVGVFGLIITPLANGIVTLFSNFWSMIFGLIF